VNTSNPARLRLAAIDFLNPAPLMWDFEHQPEKSRLEERYEIRRSTPARCAQDLATGEADIGLVPAAAYATDPSMMIIPGCTIASKGHIRSIILVTREGGPEEASTVALDTASLTSAAYTKILFHKYWNPAAEFRAFAPDLDAMLQAADAALLIGDPALLALEDSQSRLERTGEALVYHDLGLEWLSRTGVPWVSAFWGIRAEAVKETPLSPDALIRDFVHSRNRGMAHTDELVEEWASRIAIPKSVIRTYLSENIHYILDEACLDGLETFYRYAAECSALPAAPTLKLLGT
jgi:chorismate dehydratase